MAYTYEFYEKSAAYVRSLWPHEAEIGLVLGSGCGPLADSITHRLEIPYEDIPNFLRSTVATHAGKLILGTPSGKKVACMSGRFHS